jgi:hypothetical protein
MAVHSMTVHHALGVAYQLPPVGFVAGPADRFPFMGERTWCSFRFVRTGCSHLLVHRSPMRISARRRSSIGLGVRDRHEHNERSDDESGNYTDSRFHLRVSFERLLPSLCGQCTFGFGPNPGRMGGVSVTTIRTHISWSRHCTAALMDSFALRCLMPFDRNYPGSRSLLVLMSDKADPALVTSLFSHCVFTLTVPSPVSARVCTISTSSRWPLLCLPALLRRGSTQLHRFQS